LILNPKVLLPRRTPGKNESMSGDFCFENKGNQEQKDHFHGIGNRGTDV
jgi:hypothetical protein